MKIRIAFVIPNLNYGGAQTMMVRLIHAMDRDKFCVHVFVRDSRTNSGIETDLEAMGIACTYLNIGENERRGSKLFHKIRSYLIVRRALQEFSPDIVHSHLDLFYSFVYSILENKRLVVTLHGQPDRIVTRRLQLLIRILERRDRILLVGCAQCITRRAKQLLVCGNNCITTIYNPVRIDDYYSGVSKMRKEFCYIHIGRMNAIKNQELLLKAFSGVVLQEPQSRLLIVGDGALRSSLEKLCSDLGIENVVTFLGNRKDIPQLLGQADVFVLSSDSEACPMTVLEAMASGLPVISTDVGGVSELVGGAGILVKKRDEEALKAAMLEIQSSTEKRRTMSSLALMRVKRFDASVIARQYENLYYNMIHDALSDN